MPRYVRLAKGEEAPEQIGVAVLPADMDKPNSIDATGQSWQDAGYALHSYADTHEPYSEESP